MRCKHFQDFLKSQHSSTFAVYSGKLILIKHSVSLQQVKQLHYCKLSLLLNNSIKFNSAFTISSYIYLK